MRKYKTYSEFEELNKHQFGGVRLAVTQLKSPDKLGADGLALAETEKLSHFFLNAANVCTDLMFGISASCLDAQANVNSTEGLIYGQKVGGATDRNRAVACDPVYLQSVKDYNDLQDLKKYLEMKRDDFMANHYYYKGLAGGNK
jgi:hypothetical protein